MASYPLNAAASVRAAEDAWGRVVELHKFEARRRAESGRPNLGPEPDDAVLRWHAYSKREFLAAWRHVSAMWDSQSIRNDYASCLASPSGLTVRQTLRALGVDVSALLGICRSHDALAAFREQSTGIEGVLVACLGHYLARPRSLSVKLLNALYDGHDWGVASPLEAIVALTGETFSVDVWTTQPLAAGEDGDAAIPEVFRFLVAAPAYDSASSQPVPDDVRRPSPETLITMHNAWCVGQEEDVWVHCAAEGEGAGTGEGQHSSTAGPSISTASGQYTKVSTTRLRLNLGAFPRCGFFDWRLVVVAGDGSVRPATCVQPLTSQQVAAAVAEGSLPPQALQGGWSTDREGRCAPPSPVSTRKKSSNSSKVTVAGVGLLPVMHLAQGRCIVQRAGLADEHWHEAVVDLEGMSFSEGGEVVSHGTFASMAAGLGKLNSQGVTSLIVIGALERDNGWGEREPDASAANTPMHGTGATDRHFQGVGEAGAGPQLPTTSLAGFTWPGLPVPGPAGTGPGGTGDPSTDGVSDSGSEFGFIELSGDREQQVQHVAQGASGLLADGKAVTFGSPIPVMQGFAGGAEGLPGDALPAGLRAYAMRPDANPHAVVDRITPNRMLGGALGFLSLVRAAAALGMRIVVQADAAVTASRPHRKYKALYCHTLDTRGQAVVHAGTDVCENQWEDTQLLNYRKAETWDLLVSEAKTLVQNSGVGGLYLPDGQSFPFILALDTGELWRRDVDGEGHYSPREILEGEVVIANSEVGYWGTMAARSYPNPLLVKLARCLWQVDPMFAIVGESHWGRAGALARSGILPRSLDLASAVGTTLGRHIDKMGSVRSITLPSDVGPVHVLRALLDGEVEGLVPPQAAPRAGELLDEGRYPHPLRTLIPSPAGPMPRGAGRLQLRSLCATRLPYPALLLGRSAWTAVDLMYTLPGVPCTFGQESEGRAYRVDLANTYAPNAQYYEQERRKREKRLQAEKHNRRFMERTGGSGAVSMPSSRSVSGLSGHGAGMVSRPSMLHLALSQGALANAGYPGYNGGLAGPLSIGGDEQGSGGWGMDEAHVGAGGVVPAFASGGMQRSGTGLSHMDLPALGALAAGMATGTGARPAGSHRLSLSAAPPPVPPSRLGGSSLSMSSSSPALNLLLGREASIGMGVLGSPEGAWGSTPSHGQHTVPTGSGAGTTISSIFGLPAASAFPDREVAVYAADEQQEEEEEEEEEGGSDVYAQGVPQPGASSAFGFAIAGTSAHPAGPLQARLSTGRPGVTRGRSSLSNQVHPATHPREHMHTYGRGKVNAQAAEEVAQLSVVVSKAGAADVTKVQSWVPAGGLRLFAEGGAWHDKKDAIRNMRTLEDRLRYDVGPEYGFDLAKIGMHYEHRRAMRGRYRVLRDGDMNVLVARHRFGEHGHVFSFARSHPGAVAVVALNFNGHPSTFAVDTSPLANVFGATTAADASASVQQLITSALAYGEVLRHALAKAKAVAEASAAAASDAEPAQAQSTSESGATSPPAGVVPAAGAAHRAQASAGSTAGGSLRIGTAECVLPSLNLKGGVWEVRNVFESDTVTNPSPRTEAGAVLLDGSGRAQAQASAFSEADGPLVAILASDEAAYAPIMTTLAPHRSYCWLFAACAGGGTALRTPTSPQHSVGNAAWGMGHVGYGGYDRHAEVGAEAMQWLFASSLLRLQAMLRLKECGLASFVVNVQDVDAAGGYIPLLLQREPGTGEPWVSPGEMLKDEEVQAGVRHNLVYSLIRGVVKRTYRSLLSARRAAAEAGEDGNLEGKDKDSVGATRMRGVLQECAELLEGALRVIVTHLKLQEGPADPHPITGRRGPPILIADPLPPLHGAMHGTGTALPRAGNRPADPHASWYGVDPEVGAVIIRAALLLAVKDVVAQANATGSGESPHGLAGDGAPASASQPPSPQVSPGPSDVSDEDAVLSSLLIRGMARVARGQVTGGAAAAYAASDEGCKARDALPVASRPRNSAAPGGAAITGMSLASAAQRELAVMALARRLVWKNGLGPIVFVTPELGKWSTVGGLGVMVDELSVGLAELGAEVVVISPYYHLNRKGLADYLAADGIVYTSRNVTVWVGGEKVDMGVHEGVVNGVRVLFLHNPVIFPKPYPPHDAFHQVRVMAAFAKGTLELLCQWRLIPGLVVTNDWFTGLVPAYARNLRFFGSIFNRTDFLHIAHNLNPDYEGRLWPDRSQGTLAHLHELDSHLLVDPYWTDVVINPTRAALLCSDSWATVSRSYRGELLNGSPVRALLRLAPHPFAHPNGIPVKARSARLNSLQWKTHEEAKAALQRKYFGMHTPDPTVPLFAFVGRITLQKGVHLILESVDALLAAVGGRAQFLVGGMASESDSYGRHCAGMMGELRARHPLTFWADPGLFFTDGDLVNLGTDFCMMPSVFEPGGIVQQEFFVAGTPVIAFKTGGLKDTVKEWNATAGTGNGFVFESHAAAEFQWACRRAFNVFADNSEYNRLRANARASVMDLSIVCQAWYREFHRLRRCLPPPPYKPVTRVPVKFSLRLGEVPGASASTKVYVAGSFNGWSAVPSKRVNLSLNQATGMFNGIVQLTPGVYTYKFILDMGTPSSAAPPAGAVTPAVGAGYIWTTTPNAPVADDGTGNFNNVIHVLAPPTLPEDDD